jgi:Ca2+-binding EF-hand superfamily protein
MSSKLKKMLSKAALGATAIGNKPPDMGRYLSQMFSKADVKDEGRLDIHFFWRMVKKLHLRLSAQQVAALREQISGEPDGTMIWEKFVDMAPSMLQEIYTRPAFATAKADDSDWCELPIKINDGKKKKRQMFWYNKRKGESSWEKPDSTEEDEECPGVYEYLQIEFQKADADNLGYLDREQFKRMVKKLVLQLNDDDTATLLQKIDEDTDGAVDFEEFKAAPAIIQSLYDEEPDEDQTWEELFDAEWCELPSKQGWWKTYWYNKRTSLTQWDRPTPKSATELAAEAAVKAAKAIPTLETYLKFRFKQEVTGSGEEEKEEEVVEEEEEEEDEEEAARKKKEKEQKKKKKEGEKDEAMVLPLEDLEGMLSRMELQLADHMVAEFAHSFLLDNGKVTLAEFASNGSKHLHRLYQTEKDYIGDWCELPMMTSAKTFWYNKRTSSSQLERPNTGATYLVSLFAHLSKREKEEAAAGDKGDAEEGEGGGAKGGTSAASGEGAKEKTNTGTGIGRRMSKQVDNTLSYPLHSLSYPLHTLSYPLHSL